MCEEKDLQNEAIDVVEDDSVVTLVGEDGIERDFIEVAQIEYNGKLYLILQPVELFEGMDEDEAFVFAVYQTEDGIERFEVELNEEIIDGVFETYNRLLDEIDPKGACN